MQVCVHAEQIAIFRARKLEFFAQTMGTARIFSKERQPENSFTDLRLTQECEMGVKQLKCEA